MKNFVAQIINLCSARLSRQKVRVAITIFPLLPLPVQPGVHDIKQNIHDRKYGRNPSPV